MGSYLFKWEHPAQEVYVTGTFDDWGKTQKLEKVGEHFEKNVRLAKIDENIYYKFVVDDTWTTDHTDPQETDASGNTNNVLTPEHIVKDAATTTAAADTGSSDLPGAFPETPAAENQTFGVAPIAGTTGIGNPVSVRPGEPLPVSTKSVNDGVTLDKASYDNAGSSAVPAAEEQTFSVNPIAGTTGIGNPVSVKPGEALPISTKSINDNVTLDKASYDNAGKSTAPQLPDVVTPERERVAKGGMFGYDTTPGAGTIIPESGLAMGAGAGAGLGAAAALAASGPHISSVGPEATTLGLASKVPVEQRNDPFISSVAPTSTTADLASQVPAEKQNDPFISSVAPTSTTTGLASQVPAESGVPEVVEKSQEAAHVSPEASANPEAVQEKSAVEQELQSKVPEAPSTSDNSYLGKAAGIVAGTAAGATAIAAGAAAYVTSTKAGQDAKSALPVTAQQKIDDLAKSSNGSATSSTPIAPTVPDTVQESISKAHQSPEAAANAEAVNEKSAVESELLKKVHKEDVAGEPAPTASAATTTTAPKPTESSKISAAVAGGVGATAATGAALTAIANKSTSSTTPATTSAASPSTPVKSATSNANTLAAPASSQAQSDATAAKSATANTPGRDTTRKFVDSRDVSPMTRGPNDQSAPIVTTGVASAKTEAKSEATTTTPKKTTTPAPATASTPTAAVASSSTASPSSAKTGESPATDKKKNRRSGFFGRLKEKLEHRKDKN